MAVAAIARSKSGISRPVRRRRAGGRKDLHDRIGEGKHGVGRQELPVISQQPWRVDKAIGAFEDFAEGDNADGDALTRQPVQRAHRRGDAAAGSISSWVSAK
jgi:hypothetical protein